METNLEKTRYQVIEEARLTEIPDEYDSTSNKVWVRAIALVQKRDCSKNYAIVENNGDNKPQVIKDFGKTAQIVNILNIYPYVYLDASDLPLLRKQSDFVKYLENQGYDAEDIAALLSAKDEAGNSKDPEVLEKDRQLVKSYVTRIAILRKIDMLKRKEEYRNAQ